MGVALVAALALGACGSKRDTPYGAAACRPVHPKPTAPVTAAPTPVPGTYCYDQTSNGALRAVTFSDFWAPVSAGAGVRMELTEVPPGGQNLKSVTEFEWRSTQLVMLSRSFLFRTVASNSNSPTSAVEHHNNVCTWDGSAEELALPLTQGAKWHEQAQCNRSDGQTESLVADYTVTGRTSDVIDGVHVPTWVIKATRQDTVRYPSGSTTLTSDDLSLHVDPRHSLTVLMLVTESGTGAPKPTSGRRVLRSLTPV